MPKAGALKSVYVVNEDGLRTAGGRWLLQGGAAKKVRGFDVNTIGNRKLKGGDARPVYVLTQDDIRSGGGRFRISGGQAISVGNPIGAARGVIQGAAMPIFPVDDAGVFDPLFGWAYASKVVNGIDPGNLLAYWPLWESSGPIALDLSGNVRNGTYVGATLGAPGIGDGRTSPFFDGVNDYVDIYSASLGAAINVDEMSISGWFRVNNLGVWTDGTIRTVMVIGTDALNFFNVAKPVANNQITVNYGAGGVFRSRTETLLTDIGWVPFVATVSKAADELIFYLYGLAIDPPVGALGNWVGAIVNARTNIGVRIEAATEPWLGFIAHCAVWNGVLTPAQIADLAVIP